MNVIRGKQYLEIKEAASRFIEDQDKDNKLVEFVEVQIKENSNLFKETVLRAIHEGLAEGLKKLHSAGTEYSESI